MKRGSYIQEVSGVYTSPFLGTLELKMTLRARKVSGSFEKRAPGFWIPRAKISRISDSGFRIL